MTELTAGNTGTQTVVADTDLVVFEGIRKVIVALGHGSDEDANALLGPQGLDVVGGADDRRLETEGDLAAVGRQMVCDGVLDDLEQFLLRIGGADG